MGASNICLLLFGTQASKWNETLSWVSFPSQCAGGGNADGNASCPLPIPLDIQEEQVRVTQNHLGWWVIFLGAKHQSSTNTSKFQWTNICLFKELFKFSFLLLCGYNNSSKSNFRFLSSPEGFQKDVFIIIIIGHSTFRILVPSARIEPTSLAVRAGTPNHWTTRKLPQKIDFNLHTAKQRKRPITSLKRLFLQKQNQKKAKN